MIHHNSQAWSDYQERMSEYNRRFYRASISPAEEVLVATPKQDSACGVAQPVQPNPNETDAHE